VVHRRRPGKNRDREKIEDMVCAASSARAAAKGTRFAVIDFPPGNTPHMHRTENRRLRHRDGRRDRDGMDDSTVKLKQATS